MNKQTRQRVHELYLAESRRKYPNLPDHVRSVKMPSDTTANGLTRLIIDWVNMSGYHAERINTMGRVIDKRKNVTDVVGRQKTIGSMTYIPTSGQRGSADISCTLAGGKSVKIEIKIGKDRQSEHQKVYQQQIERSGGIYIIVRSMEDFLNYWDNLTINKNGQSNT
jgi:hypothetical protein